MEGKPQDSSEHLEGTPAYSSTPNNNTAHSPEEPARRDFMVLSASALAGLGAAMVVLPALDSLNPSADVLALSSIEVDLSAIQPGQNVTVKWRGKPVFIRHRTPQEIAEAEAVPMTDLKDPEADSLRVKEGHTQWLIMVGICTHLGCVPVGNSGDYNGWYCPCHGSQYDVSGRIRKGPAPTNLAIPPYQFLTDTTVRIG